MKKLIYIVFGISIATFACTGKKSYHMKKTEKKEEKGYHANSSNQVIDENAKNKKTNLNHSEKNRQATNKKAQEAAAHSGKAKKHHGHFKHYMH
jgi:hypothetical protein